MQSLCTYNIENAPPVKSSWSLTVLPIFWNDNKLIKIEIRLETLCLEFVNLAFHRLLEMLFEQHEGVFSILGSFWVLFLHYLIHLKMFVMIEVICLSNYILFVFDIFL